MNARVQQLVDEHRYRVHRGVDRFFAVLMLGQWLAGIAVALVRTPLAGTGAETRVHPNVWAAVVIGGLLSALPVVLAAKKPGAPATKYVNAIAQMAWSALLIHLTGGRTETHFHVFGSLAFLGFYREWRVLIPATLVTFENYFVSGVTENFSSFVEHAFWIAFVDAFLITACITAAREMRQMAVSRAEIESLSSQLTVKFRERTAELANAQKQLVAAERMSSVGTLAAGVAHEINNPLAFILGNVDYAVRELRSPNPDLPETLTALEEAKVGGGRVRDIVRDLKLFARPPAEKTGATPVEPLLERSISMAANEIRHRARLVRDYGNVPPAAASESRLGQVFLNLLINAAQAIPEGRADENEIRVATRLVDGFVEIEIADTGCGIPENVRERIFDPFFTTKPVGVGTGLGLSICHGIITSLGGSITVESEVGKGTQFRVRLPATAPNEVKTGAPLESRMDSIETKDILVIDDEPLLARSLRRVLAPHRVIAETSGKEALIRMAAGERFDLVICDVMMPEMAGPEVFAELRRVAPDQADRVVFLTGGAFTENAKEFLSRTSQPVLEKPADPAEIRRILDSFAPLSVAARRRPTLTSLSGALAG